MEERLADELSTDRAEASAARTLALAVLRRLGRYDRAAYVLWGLSPHCWTQPGTPATNPPPTPPCAPQ